MSIPGYIATARDEQADPESTVAETLTFIVERAARLLAAKRVWLFGSRAVRRARRHSDIDVAVELNAHNRVAWGEFAAGVHDSAPTLLSIDLVDIDQCACNLRTEIMQTGRLIYERPRS